MQDLISILLILVFFASTIGLISIIEKLKE